MRLNGPPFITREPRPKSPDIGLSVARAIIEAAMNTKLPQAITNYFQASNAHDTNGVIGAFSDDALVIDENREYRGSAAIRAWSEEALSKYQPHAAVTDATEAGDKIVVTAKVSGTFPASPVQLRFAFTLERDKIGALRIEA